MYEPNGGQTRRELVVESETRTYYCNKLYIGETGRRLVNRFREHLRDVERNDKDAIFLIILNSIWQFAAFPYI